MKNRLIGVAVVCLLIPGVLLAQPAEKKTIVGVWEVKMALAGQPQSPFLSLATYGSDGSFTTCGGYKTLPPIPAVQEVANELGSGYGRWAAEGNRQFRLTFYSIMWKEGLANAYQRAQETLVLSESGDEYTGHAQVDFLDSNWNVVFSTTSEVKGTRLETPAMLIEQPAEKKRLVGVWEVKVSPVGQSPQSSIATYGQWVHGTWVPLNVPQSPQLSIAMYGTDGNFTTSTLGGYKAFPPIPAIQDVANERGPGYGRWAATSGKEFRLTFYSVMWKAGLVNGYQRVQDTLVLSESGDEYTGHAHVDFLDANWKVVFSTTTDVMGRRLETPVPAMPEGQAAEKNQLVGVWAIKSLGSGEDRWVPGIDIFSADGSFIQTRHKRSPWGTVDPGQGRYAAIGRREFRLMFYVVELNKEGVVWGFARVETIFTLSESGDELTARVSHFDTLDGNWTPVYKGTSDVTATRLETPDQE